MVDYEYRIMLTGDGKVVESVAVFVVEEDGQVSMVDAFEVGPFETHLDVIGRVVRRVVRDGVLRFKAALS